MDMDTQTDYSTPDPLTPDPLTPDHSSTDHTLSALTTPAALMAPALVTLVTRARGGDTRAFDQIVRRFQDMAVGYGTALLGDPHSAQDAAQEAFLEAYRTLPALRCPAAFPGWLRLLVRKHCDRRTRGPEGRATAISLADVTAVTATAVTASDVGRLVVEQEEARQTRASLRAAVRALPEGERAAVVLFYGGERSLSETAAFLGVPVTVVKNRLYRARRRLKERLVSQMAQTLEGQRPSNDDRFRERVFVRLQDEFFAQYRQDPLTADRSLLMRSRDEFERHLTGQDPLEPDAAHFGSRLYTTLHDYVPLADLMTRYRSQPLPLAEEAWARHEQVRALSATGRSEDVVREQRAFVEWAREHLPGDPPIRLSDPGSASFRPLREGEDAWSLPADALLPWVVNVSEVSRCFKEMGLQDEWAQSARSLVGAAPQTRASRLCRFWALRCVVMMYYGKDTLAEALRATQDIAALGDEEADWEAPRWAIEAAYMQMVAYSEAGDSAAARARAEEATRLLEEYGARIGDTAGDARGAFLLLCDNVGSSLADRGHCDLALRLFAPLLAAGGRATGWAHVRYAACLWATTQDKAGDRERTLEMLRRGAPRELSGGLLNFFRSRPAFADVKDDPEFIAAMTVPERRARDAA